MADAPAPSPDVFAPFAADQRPSLTTLRLHEERPQRRHEVPASKRSRAAVATAALLALGVLSGASLAVYWTWGHPLVVERVVLPNVRRPARRVAAPLPAVVSPAIDGVGDDIALPQIPDPLADEPPDTNAGPARPVATTQVVWTVQVGAFAEETRATTLVGQLKERGFPVFTSAGALRGGTALRLVLAGPYTTKTAAAKALDQIEEIPGIGRPQLRAVPPALP